ncbi:leishmanolysin-related zinc metalloendopeptidase [Phenylobacterium sp.]|uniref:leishmanolysin-related zinc metalloendopeptidase n=1 Tax=Phenylobacterium sp. TaxID=1871053 RepID=UPI002FC732FF
MATTERFDFSAFDNGVGNSGFGFAHGPGVDLRPQLPETTPDLIGVDLTHRIDVADVAFAAAAGGASGKPGGGGGGGGGGISFSPYTTTASAYNITIEFKGGSWTQDLHDVFVSAADRLANLIVGDVQNVNVIMKGGLRLVDDILITAELKNIDGAGGILGQAGPTSVRTGSYLPATASMQFDIADAANFFAQGLFDEIVGHEMIHSVGFGTIWSYLGLVSGTNFIGAKATAEYNALLGDGSAAGVPLETGGGSGTAGSHWSEAIFAHELMTGYIDAAPDPLSRMTVASLQDLGYQVSYSGPIDGYALA